MVITVITVIKLSYGNGSMSQQDAPHCVIGCRPEYPNCQQLIPRSVSCANSTLLLSYTTQWVYYLCMETDHTLPFVHYL